jgi:hypothetical protein
MYLWNVIIYVVPRREDEKLSAAQQSCREDNEQVTDKERNRLYFAIQKFRDATFELDQSLNKADGIDVRQNYPFDKSFSEVAINITKWLDSLNREINAET